VKPLFAKTRQGRIKVEIRKGPGTLDICAAIINHYNVDAVPYINCGRFSKRETEVALFYLQF
jgi:methylenetetrahydrofolate reductase (NADPH)